MSGPTRDSEFAQARIKADLEYHQARILLLVNAVAPIKGNGHKLDGLTKLAKLDFLVRYPALAKRVLPDGEERITAAEDEEIVTESPMVRYKYGPWDDRYYPVIGALVGRGLLAYARGRAGSVALRMTPTGRALVKELAESDEWSLTHERCQIVADRVGAWTGNQLKEEVYRTLPEVVGLSQREVIR